MKVLPIACLTSNLKNSYHKNKVYVAILMGRKINKDKLGNINGAKCAK